MQSWYRWEGDDLVLRIRIQPGSRRDAWAGEHGERYRVQIKAPPVDGKANRQLRLFLAGEFGVPRSAVIIESGETQRNKRARIRSPSKFPSSISSN